MPSVYLSVTQMPVEEYWGVNVQGRQTVPPAKSQHKKLVGMQMTLDTWDVLPEPSQSPDIHLKRARLRCTQS